LSKYSNEEWSKIREQGKLVYIITHWILSAAFPIAIVLIRWNKNEKVWRG